MKKIWIPDFGHGGMINRVYQTAPRKMYEHPNFVIYEGVFNRSVGGYLISMMEKFGMKYVDISSGQLDLPLGLRSKYANLVSAVYGPGNCVGISVHGNAGKGTGFEVWTSPGYTKSDPMADVLALEIMKEFPDETFRSDRTDPEKDYDKESPFHILTKTNCPWVLSENGFMDRLKDAKKMMTSEFQYKVAKAHFEWMRKIEESEL